AGPGRRTRAGNAAAAPRGHRVAVDRHRPAARTGGVLAVPAARRADVGRAGAGDGASGPVRRHGTGREDRPDERRPHRDARGVLRREPAAVADVLARRDAVAFRRPPLDTGALAARRAAGTGATRPGALGLRTRTGTHRSPPARRPGTAACGTGRHAPVGGLRTAQRAAPACAEPVAHAIVAAGGV